MMDDQSANQQANSTNNYVDDYFPPQDAGSSSVTPAVPPVAPTPPPQPALTPTISTTPPAAAPAASSGPISQALEDQNIFTLLGVEDGTDEDKEKFLDELQQVIWEDFIENDVELLLTEEEMGEVKKTLANAELSEEDKQEQVVVYLEKLIPDLEEIMLEKALELKEEMVRERVAGLTEFFADNSEKVQSVKQAEAMLNEGKWKDAADLLNKITS